MPASEEVALVLAWIVVALASAAVMAPLWFLFPRKKRPLLPPHRQYAVPWTGLEVGLALFLYFLFWPLVIYVLLRTVGFLSTEGANALPAKLESARQNLWVAVFAGPFWVASVIALFRLVSGTRLYQLGLSAHGAVRNLKIGWLAWLVISPVVLALHILVLWIYSDLMHGMPEKHLLTRLAQALPSVIEWILIIVSAVVVAPVTEELLFRGILQGWLTPRPWGGHAAMAASFVAALCFSADRIQEAWSTQGLGASLKELGPALFVLSLVPGYLLATRVARRWLPRPQAIQAIYGTALFFAIWHSSIWPTPIPLFVLGLALGFLAYRTQSLVAPIFLHALFNSVSCLIL